MEEKVQISSAATGRMINAACNFFCEQSESLER